MTRTALTSTLLLALTFTSASAFADAADGGATMDVPALEKQLDDERAALATSDCGAACRALASIRRAADKICALEPGPRCDAARSKAADATSRVREACPDCAVASIEPPPPPRPGETNSTRTVQYEAAAPARSGGCGSCAAVDRTGPSGDVALLVLGVLGAVRIALRKKKERKRL